MVTVYYDMDADLSVLNEEIVAIIGYGNVGRAFALNMRDSGVNVIIGTKKDPSWDQAIEDEFAVYPVAEAANRGTIIFMIIPDEVQFTVYDQHIKDNLSPGKAIGFTHGYNIHYGFIAPPDSVDVLLLAPKVGGFHIREHFVNGKGAPAFIYVRQDASGKAQPRLLALTKAVGATRIGALEINFAKETELDLFMEHWLAPIIKRTVVLAYDVLVEEFGYDPEAVLLELYLSGERAEFYLDFAKTGIFKEIKFHSPTSQYGTLTRAPRVLPDDTKKIIRDLVNAIQTGIFAREWQLEQLAGYPVFKKFKEQALKHPMNKIERRVKELIKIDELLGSEE